MSLNTAASLAQLKASDPSATVWVNANAGSGKTHVLVDRVVRLMLGGTEPFDGSVPASSRHASRPSCSRRSWLDPFSAISSMRFAARRSIVGRRSFSALRASRSFRR